MIVKIAVLQTVGVRSGEITLPAWEVMVAAVSGNKSFLEEAGENQPQGFDCRGWKEGQDSAEREPWETVGEQETGGWWDPCAETARRERAAVPKAEIQGAERTLDLGRKKSLRTPGSSVRLCHIPTYNGTVRSCALREGSEVPGE